MPIAKLKYNLPEEQSEFYMAIKGSSCFFALHELMNFLRSERKNGKNVSDFEDKFWEIINSHDINFDEVE